MWKMKEILIFAGTTEGRRLSECLSKAGIRHTLCVATEYGELVLKNHPSVKVHSGRMDRDQIAEYIREGNFAVVVDATHPYARIVTENIKMAMQGMDIPYLRLRRDMAGTEETVGEISYFATNQACARALAETDGNILLTTGSKELDDFCIFPELKSRLYVRVLPGMESLTLCMDHEISGRQILALQGPFTAEMNEAMIRQYQIKYLVTKVSGMAGGYQEKLKAAERVGIPVFVIGERGEDPGYSFREVCRKLEDICGEKISLPGKMEIVLAGVGMGNKNNLTEEVSQAIKSADILLGAERMIAPYQARVEKKPYYRADQIIPYLKGLQKDLDLEDLKIVILFSGDSGFYSGCQNLHRSLDAEICAGALRASVHIMPGISSVAHFAACIGESYQDAAVLSMHGKEIPDLANRIRKNAKTFLLMSGARDVRMLGELLQNAEISQCMVQVGYQLSYPEQQIKTLTPEECCGVYEEGLYICCIKNPHVECVALTHGKADDDFIRDRVPMTKEEVREVSICKLKLQKNAIVYDIGSGTGSIAVETAGLSDDIQVFAFERKKEAVCLIEKNRKKFHADNVSVIAREAPEGFVGLPVPTHAFIGGSGSRLKDILSALFRMNPGMRIVINAVSVETICEIKEILSQYPVDREEIVQMQVSRAKRTGEHHLMLAENPVWICSFNFCSMSEVKQNEA